LNIIQECFKQKILTLLYCKKFLKGNVRTGGMAQVEHRLANAKALSPNSGTARKERKKERKDGGILLKITLFF
jgi:hypothetical protein